MVPGLILGIQGAGLGFAFIGYMMWQQYFITVQQALVMAIFGCVITVIGGLASWILDHVKGTVLLKDSDQPGRYLIWHISRGGVMQPMWGYRTPQGQIGIKGKGMFRDRGEGASICCGHPSRMVFETIGATLDPQMLIAINEIMAKYGVDTIYQARKMSEIITRYNGSSDDDLKNALNDAGFNPDPVLIDREYNKKLAVIAKTYFDLRKNYATKTQTTPSEAVI